MHFIRTTPVKGVFAACVENKEKIIERSVKTKVAVIILGKYVRK